MLLHRRLSPSRSRAGAAARLALPLVLLVPACETLTVPPPEELQLWDDASAGVANRELARLCDEYWNAWLAHEPIQATYLGDPRFHGDVTDQALQPLDEWRRELEEFSRRLRTIDRGALTESDSITREMLSFELEKELMALDIDAVAWLVDPLEGPHTMFLNVTAVQPTETARMRQQVIERWSKIDGFLRVKSQHLLRGKRKGRVSSRKAVEKSIQQIDAILATDPFDSPFVQIATGGGKWVKLKPTESVAMVAHEHLGDARRQGDLRKINLHLQEGRRLAVGTRVLIPGNEDRLPVELRGRFLFDALHATEDQIYPALASYREFLAAEILPAARPDTQPGLKYLPGGESAYRKLIQTYTSLPAKECDPKAIHEFGLAEVTRIRNEIATLGERLFQTRDVSLIQERLRTDAAMHFRTREEVAAKARESLARAEAEIGRWFGRLPVAGCRVVEIPRHEEKDTTIAYYREPAANGTRPGTYYINTYKPETRPRYEAEVLAYHEAIPGHHLQIAIAQELDAVPLFRRHAGSTAFVEGWALYTERLSDEMGLYSEDLDRMGVLSFDAWRASRLVVDTGIHAFGWSRERAIAYLFENTLLAKNNVENEVDRYIAWPGQALAYKIGQREFLELREQAREALGARFSYPEFHDRVLENGALSLAALRGVVGRWLGLPEASTR